MNSQSQISTIGKLDSYPRPKIFASTKKFFNRFRKFEQTFKKFILVSDKSQNKEENEFKKLYHKIKRYLFEFSNYKIQNIKDSCINIAKTLINNSKYPFGYITKTKWVPLYVLIYKYYYEPNLSRIRIEYSKMTNFIANWLHQNQFIDILKQFHCSNMFSYNDEEECPLYLEKLDLEKDEDLLLWFLDPWVNRVGLGRDWGVRLAIKFYGRQIKCDLNTGKILNEPKILQRFKDYLETMGIKKLAKGYDELYRHSHFIYYIQCEKHSDSDSDLELECDSDSDSESRSLLSDDYDLLSYNIYI